LLISRNVHLYTFTIALPYTIRRLLRVNIAAGAGRSNTNTRAVYLKFNDKDVQEGKQTCSLMQNLRLELHARWLNKPTSDEDCNDFYSPNANIRPPGFLPSSVRAIR
jgi:hypothetical protein